MLLNQYSEHIERAIRLIKEGELNVPVHRAGEFSVIIKAGEIHITASNRKSGEKTLFEEVEDWCHSRGIYAWEAKNPSLLVFTPTL